MSFDLTSMVHKKLSEYHFQNVLRTAFALLALLFSFFLMFHTFSYDPNAHGMRISTKVWSDFGAHIPLIRSFSQGPNLTRLLANSPIESPLYPGEPIRYHFGFYALVGILEKLGVRIDWALNIPSALGFFLLLLCIWTLSYRMFASRFVSLLSVLFFLSNGSLSFLKFFADHPFSIHTLSNIVNNARFPSFGPWDGGDISAFWTLNIYTNQRHLALSYALALCAIITCAFPQAKKKPSTIFSILTLAAIMSTLVLINYPTAAIATIWLWWIGIRTKDVRINLFAAAAITLPIFLWVHTHTNLTQIINIHPGYLIRSALTPTSVILYWWHNIGAHLFLIPLGLVLSPRRIRQIMIIPLLVTFLLPNLYQFSPDMINNHKFFNFFIIIGGMFSAFAIVKIGHIKRIGPMSLICLIFLLTLSGVIDFFPVLNDYSGMVPDLATNPDVQFFTQHTQPGDIVANSTWFYHPASLAGRSLFSGYSYFTWSYGYDQTKREQEMLTVYRAATQNKACVLLKNYGISYVELSQYPENYVKPNMILWNSLIPVYENPDTHLKVYATRTICAE